MSIPTFSPPLNPSFNYAENPQILTDSIPMHKGYDQKRPLLIRPVRRVRANWKAANRATKDYIFSFFQALNGTVGPFYWTPCDKVPDPTCILPTLSQVSGGALSSRTYYVAFTWYNAVYGETKQSATSSLAVSANYYLVVSVPPFPTWISSWRLYAHETPGSECLQTTINSARTWTQSSALATGTASPPSTNTLNLPIKWSLAGNVINCEKFAANRYQISLDLVEQTV